MNRFSDHGTGGLIHLLTWTSVFDVFHDELIAIVSNLITQTLSLMLREKSIKLINLSLKPYILKNKAPGLG